MLHLSLKLIIDQTTTLDNNLFKDNILVTKVTLIDITQNKTKKSH